MRAVGYTSINTLSQRPKNLALVDQEKIIRDYAAERGWELVEVYKEMTVSSNPSGQPLLEEVLADSAGDNYQVLIIARLDRLSRNIRKLNVVIDRILKNTDKGLVSIEEGLDSYTETGELALKIIDIVTKWDNKKISDRTREIIAHKRAKGERVGHAPYGYMYKDKKLVQVKKEMQVVQVIALQRNEGMSYHKIARELNDKKTPSKRGGIWYAETVKTVFQNSLKGPQDLQEIS